MRWLKSVSKALWAGTFAISLAGASFGQGKLVDVDPHPGVLYCSNQSLPMQCTDDAGATWHDIEYFRGRYRKALLLSDKGKVTNKTVPIPPPEPQAKPTPQPVQAGVHEVMLGVQINGQPEGDSARLAQDEDGKLYVPSDLIAQWRLQVFQGQSLRMGGQTYYRLDALNGVQWHIDPATQTLALTVAPSAFAPTNLNASFREQVEAERPQSSLFLNHQLVYSNLQGTSTQPRSNALGGLFEAGAISSLGVMTSRFADGDFTAAIHPIRLDTKLAKEFPDHMALLTIGDSVSAGNAWSRQVTYGGISWGSDFATQPSFVPIVLPNLQGQATQPSTVDLYVNGIRTSQQKVDPGPFTINNIPVITTQGDLQMVITDVLGRQQVITQPFISAQELLRPGVNAYTYEGGILRRNFGFASNEYGSLFAEGQQRHGFTDQLTGDARVEASGKQQTGSVGLEFGVSPLGIIGGGVALSHSSLGPGGLTYLLVQHRARRFGYSGTVQVASSTFQQLGMATGERAPKLQGQVQVGEALGTRCSIAVGYLRQENRTFLNNTPMKPDFAGVTSSFSVRVAKRMFITAAANLSNSSKNASSATVNLVVPLGVRSMASSTSNIQRDGTQLTSVQYLQTPPVGTGYGYRVRSDIGGPNTQQNVDADFIYQSTIGSYEAEANEIGSAVSTRLTETGSVLMMGGHVLPAQWLNNSFALVEVPDTSGVKVFANNQYIASTSWRGLAVLPILAPYVKNTVRLDDQGVPIDLGIDLDEKTVVPMTRSGAILKFKALRFNGASFRLVTDKGDPVPNGAEVTVGDFRTTYDVALHGEVFIPNISFPALLHVHWGDQRCDANVESANTKEPLPHIGPVTCKVVQ